MATHRKFHVFHNLTPVVAAIAACGRRIAEMANDGQSKLLDQLSASQLGTITFKSGSIRTAASPVLAPREPRFAGVHALANNELSGQLGSLSMAPAANDLESYHGR